MPDAIKLVITESRLFPGLDLLSVRDANGDDHPSDLASLRRALRQAGCKVGDVVVLQLESEASRWAAFSDDEIAALAGIQIEGGDFNVGLSVEIAAELERRRRA